ncbi:hypothetical protein HanXRQr2_Chr07g0294211 [Helianthus annuus]|uniref:DUF8204 domain-containing protein n=1 Tax=Helianthus annuus TaxID=4232 RepID=A0A251SVE1_HELAN|nr:uncharacterized protein LOC110899472 [Helianthus annuus]KAF5798547.1 hypothetical protein HanXRQr2_Chr07g0294211 [Helianthus annuus]
MTVGDEQVERANPSSKDHNNLHSSNEKLASRKGKSCKGCLYYSSTLKSNSRNPVCVGITRSLPKVPRYYVGESEMEASKEGRSLADFRYGCAGYSVYPDMKNHSGDVEETQKELPVCVGIEVLVDRRVSNANPAPTHAHNKDNHATPQPRVNRPAQSASDDFFSRFTRNANIVASGVAKNVRKVGNQIKESVDDIMYPYRRRPK